MAGESIDVIDPLAGRGGGGRAAHPLAERDADTGRQALERPHHQLAAIEEVEADPIEVGQCMEQQCREIGRIGDAVAFALHQGAGLSQKVLVLLGLVAAWSFDGEHGGGIKNRDGRHKVYAVRGHCPSPPKAAGQHPADGDGGGHCTVYGNAALSLVVAIDTWQALPKALHYSVE